MYYCCYTDSVSGSKPLERKEKPMQAQTHLYQPLPWWCQLGWQFAIMAAVDVLVALLLHVIPAIYQ